MHRFDKCLENPAKLVCSCENFPFVNKSYEQILSGDLQVIQNNKENLIQRSTIARKINQYVLKTQERL